MLQPRITPCLLIQDSGLVKTTNFKNSIYVGDPINAVKIFNEKEVDELIVLDIDSTVKKTEPNYDLIYKIASECRMPLCYGGGINSLSQIDKIISLGVEKIAICSAINKNPDIFIDASKMVGSQSIVGVIELNKINDEYFCFTNSGKTKINYTPEQLINFYQKNEVGEILINLINKDGLMSGYDLDYISKLSEDIFLPFTILGGASGLDDFKLAYSTLGIVGMSAGSIFVFKGNYKAVLINYLNKDEKLSIFK